MKPELRTISMPMPSSAANTFSPLSIFGSLTYSFDAAVSSAGFSIFFACPLTNHRRRAYMSAKELGRFFVKGIVAISPSIIMILMAASIKYTMTEAKILDTILHSAAQMAGSMPKAGVVLFIYAICLVMNFFISSGSAKAFLLIPIIAPLAQLFGISMQLAIVAFAFGDGFSNVIYPTNAGLLITLGLTDVSYGEWFRYSWKFQLLNLLLTCGILLFGLAVGY